MCICFIFQHLKLKAAIAGAVSTIYIYEDAKNTCLAPLLKHHEEAKIYGVDEVWCPCLSILSIGLLPEKRWVLADLRSTPCHGYACLSTGHELRYSFCLCEVDT